MRCEHALALLLDDLLHPLRGLLARLHHGAPAVGLLELLVVVDQVAEGAELIAIDTGEAE